MQPSVSCGPCGRSPSTHLVLALAALLGAACRSAPDAPAAEGASPAVRVHDDHALVDTASGASLTFDELADALSLYDVVFLGEEHDNDVIHRLQAELSEALVLRRGDVILSLEMFERDAQPALDEYLAGTIDEQAFLARSRPWPNYAEHYRPAIELAKREGLPVLAGNVPRPLAARVVREGPLRVLSAPYAPRYVLLPDGLYRARFDAIMGGHGGIEGVDPDDVFASQCIKDDAMAESIADALALHPGALVVHWCGCFHSDAHLGTVERLARRRPDLTIAVVTPTTGGDLGAPLTDEERANGDFVLRAPAQPKKD
jgi:uncharacterized iron-regulated protein